MLKPSDEEITEAEIEARLDAHPDLVERLHCGDADAFTEMLEVMGAKVQSMTVRLLADDRYATPL